MNDSGLPTTNCFVRESRKTFPPFRRQLPFPTKKRTAFPFSDVTARRYASVDHPPSALYELRWRIRPLAGRFCQTSVFFVPRVIRTPGAWTASSRSICGVLSGFWNCRDEFHHTRFIRRNEDIAGYGRILRMIFESLFSTRRSRSGVSCAKLPGLRTGNLARSSCISRSRGARNPRREHFRPLSPFRLSRRP